MEYLVNDTNFIVTTETSAVARPPKAIPLISSILQAGVLTIILIAALLTNAAIIVNISRDSLKRRMTHFCLIRHVTITDSVGALFVLPIPLISFAQGHWDWSPTTCTILSTTTACCWTMHLVAVALYRADRVLAVWLPTGRYPIISVKLLHVLLLSCWVVVFAGCVLATYTFSPAFQPALALCIPNVPIIFFILVFTCYCIALVVLICVYVIAFLRRRKRKKRRKEARLDAQSSSNQPQENNNSQKSPRSVNFEDPSTTSNTTPISTRPLTPPFHSTRSLVASAPTHRRVHSDGIVPPIIGSSRESVVSVQYRSLSKRSNDSSEFERACVEESLAEKLDECDSEVVCPPKTRPETSVIESKRRSRAARCRVFASYAVSVGHLVLYLPAMVTIALLGGRLNPYVAFVCGLVVYCEFIVQPIALLLVSPKLAREVRQMVFGGGTPGCVSSVHSIVPHASQTTAASSNTPTVTAQEISSSAGGGVEVIDETLESQEKR